MILLSSSLVAIALAAPADPTQNLERRKATLSKSNTITIGGKAPLDAIILIGFGLLAALICFFIALWNVYLPQRSGSQELRDERARAKTELRLKGGKGGNPISPIMRNVVEKKHSHFVGADVVEPQQSTSKIDQAPAYKTPRDRPSGPRVAPDASNARASRAFRGYNADSKYDNQTPSTGSSTPASLLALPVLPGAYFDNQSTPSTSSLSAATPPIPGALPWQIRPSQDQNRSQITHTRQFSSSSIARGIDLDRKRKSLRYTKNLMDTPEVNDAMYPMPDQFVNFNGFDPLSHSDHKQYPPDPSYDLDKTIADDFVNAYDVYGNINNGVYDVPSYEQNSLSSQIPNPYAVHLQEHQLQPVVQQASPTRSIGSINRSKPLAFYDVEQDLGGIHQDTALLDGTSPSKQSPRKLWAQF